MCPALLLLLPRQLREPQNRQSRLTGYPAVVPKTDNSPCIIFSICFTGSSQKGYLVTGGRRQIYIALKYTSLLFQIQRETQRTQRTQLSRVEENKKNRPCSCSGRFVWRFSTHCEKVMIPTAVGSEPRVCHVSLSQRLSSAVSCGSPSFCGSAAVRPSPSGADRCPLGGSRSGPPLVSVCSEPCARVSLVCAAPMVWVCRRTGHSGVSATTRFSIRYGDLTLMQSQLFSCVTST